MAKKVLVGVLLLSVGLASGVHADVLTQCREPNRGGSEDWEVLALGYCDHLGRWVPGLVTFESWVREAPAHSIGNVVWYNPGIMEATAEHVGFSLEGYLDGIAMMSCSDFGKTAWLRRPGLTWEGPYAVVDCASRVDIFSAVYYHGEVAEVGYQTALSWGMVESVDDRRIVNQWILHDVEVFVGEAPSGDESVAVDYAGWWLDQVVFVGGFGFDEAWGVNPEPN